MKTIVSTFAYHPADTKKADLILPTHIVKRYAFSNPAMAAARKRHGDPNLESDILQNGIFSPLIIKTNGASGLLGDGYLRLGIAEKIGLKRLPVQIHPDNFKRLRSENGFPSLDPRVAAWVEKYLWTHNDHYVTRHLIGGSGSMGIPATKWVKCVCSCKATWKEEQ